MSTFAETLKKEVTRLARKELKGEILSLRKASTTYRGEIAALKRELKGLASRCSELQRQMERMARQAGAREVAPPKPAAAPKDKTARSFDADAFAQLRKELELTQAQMGRLVEASALSVWKWESGQVTPRAGALSRIEAAFKMGKRAARAKALAE